MQDRKKQFCIAVFMGLSLIGLQAQSILNVNEYSESTSVFYITNVKKLTFSSGNMNVEKSDKSSDKHAISDIRKLDFSWTSTNIEIISQPSLKESAKIKLFPNPVKNQLFIKYNFAEECKVIVEIMDLQSNIILKETIQPMTSINVSMLRKGMYICRVHVCDKIENIKFLIQ